MTVGGVTDGDGVLEGVSVLRGVGVMLGVKVARGVRVNVGVHVGSGVFVAVAVGGNNFVGVTKTSGGYSSSIAVYQFSPPVSANSVKRAPR